METYMKDKKLKSKLRGIKLNYKIVNKNSYYQVILFKAIYFRSKF